MKRVGIYIRVSTEEQSSDLQRRELIEFCFNRGWKGKIYDDSATGTHTNRPALKTLLKDCRQRQLDVVICWKLDRLARSLKDLVFMLQEFNSLGVEFVCPRDNIDLTTPAGKLMMHIIGAFAEFESSLISERTKAG